MTQSIRPEPQIDGKVSQDELRKGDLVRRNHRRTVAVICTACGDEFVSTGQGAIHARTHRHTVAVDYFVAFSFIPNELRGAR